MNREDPPPAPPSSVPGPGRGPHCIEHDLIELSALLEAESAALRTQGTEAAATLSRLAEQKLAVVARLQALTGPTEDDDAGERFSLTPEIVERLKRIRTLNRRNGALVELRARHTDRLFAILHGVDEAAAALAQTYDAAGAKVRGQRPVRYQTEA